MTTTTTRKPKTLADVKADPRIERVYRDSDGLWIELRYGFKNTYDEPRGALHGIHENSLKDALLRWDGIQPCDCHDCTLYLNWTCTHGQRREAACRACGRIERDSIMGY